MIIDLILDRKGGVPYEPKKFYDSVMGYYETLGTGEGIADAMDDGEEADVRREIRRYLLEHGYAKPGNEHTMELFRWINSVNWISNA